MKNTSAAIVHQPVSHEEQSRGYTTRTGSHQEHCRSDPTQLGSYPTGRIQGLNGDFSPRVPRFRLMGQLKMVLDDIPRTPTCSTCWLVTPKCPSTSSRSRSSKSRSARASPGHFCASRLCRALLRWLRVTVTRPEPDCHPNPAFTGATRRSPYTDSSYPEAPVGIEPTNSRFAVCRLTTWPRRRTPKLTAPHPHPQPANTP